MHTLPNILWTSSFDIFPYNYFSIEIFKTGFEPPSEVLETKYKPFNDIDDTIKFSQTLPVIRYTDLGSCVPFGIFPISDKDCFGLITGKLEFQTSLNMEEIKKIYQQHEIRLEKLPQTTSDKLKFGLSLLESPTGSAEQNKLFEEGFFDYQVFYANFEARVSNGYFSEIFRDLIDPISFLGNELLKLHFMSDYINKDILKPGKSRLHISRSEQLQWK